jgi:prepilin-type N-terminal cleavage/methylation domain-containing protein
MRKCESRLKGRAQEGFTLIELLVVVCIIGILAVFLLMNLAHALRKAREGRTYAHLTTLRTAFESWSAAEGQNYTPVYNGVPIVGGNATNGNPWAIKQGSYFNPNVFSGWWVPEDGVDGWGVEKGAYGVNFNRYMGDHFPNAEVSNDEASYGIWKWQDGTVGMGMLSNGVYENNSLPTDPNGQPGGGVANMNYRGWHYRNTDGLLRINNTSKSTEGRQYDTY